MENFEAMFNDGMDSVQGTANVATPVVTEEVPVQEAPVQNVTQSTPVNQANAQVDIGSQTMVAATQTTAPDAVADDFEIDLPAELQASLEEMGVVVGEIGTKVSKVPIEKYKASTSKVDRISFLTKKVIALKFHYIDGVGSIVCFNGKCCEMGGTPQVRYLFPIAVYSTDSDGNISGKKVELKVLSAGEDLYKSIMTINKGTSQYGGIDHVDLLVTCTDDKYQKLSLTFAGNAVWRQYAPIAEFLKERWAKDGANAYMAIARKCDEASFLKLIGMDYDDDAGAPASQFDATKNQDLSKFFDN